MPSPFPGMNPYLEDAELWPDVHLNLISEVMAQLQPALRPRYVARVEQRTFTFDIDDPASLLYVVPDVRVVRRTTPAPTNGRASDASTGGGAGGAAVAERVDVTHEVLPVARHRFIELRDTASREVVTVIEVVSPSNKLPGAGLRAFREKREDVHRSGTNWVEIDLLRGRRTFRPPPRIGEPAYLIFSDELRAAEDGEPERRQFVTPIELRQRLPVVPIPLRAGEEPVPLDLQNVLDVAYDRADYDGSVDYAADPPAPPLLADDATWLDALLREKGLR